MTKFFEVKNAEMVWSAAAGNGYCNLKRNAFYKKNIC